MASSEDDVVVRLRLKDVKAFIADVKAGKLAIEDLERQVRKTGDTADKVSAQGTGGFSKLTSHFQTLGYWAMRGVGALAVAGAGVAAYAVKSASDLEQVSVAFTTLLHSSSAATKMVSDLQAFAKTTPFELSGVEQTTQRLLAFGFSAKSIIPTLTAIGNAASGLNLGQQGMDEIALVLGQMKSLGRVQGQDLLQLAQHGVNGYGILEQGLGLTPAAFQKAMQAGKISAAVGVPLLLKGMQKQYAGLMDKESATLGGIWSNFHDALQQGLIKVVNPFLPVLKEWLQKAVDALPGIMDRLQGGIARAGQWIGRAMDVIPYLRTGDDAGASNIIARLFGDSDGKTAPTIEHLIGLVRNLGSIFAQDLVPAMKDFSVILGLVGPLLATLDGTTGFIADHSTTFHVALDLVVGSLIAYRLAVWGMNAGIAAYNLVTDWAGLKTLKFKDATNAQRLAMIAWKVAVWAATAAQWLWNVALDANPIGVVILALAALGVALYEAYQHSEPFREFVNGLWSDMKGFADWIAGVWNVTVGNMGQPKFMNSDGTPISPTAAGFDAGAHVARWWLDPLGSIAGALGGAVGDKIKTHQAAGGTTVRPGLSWVGERGPELLNMPRGAQVIPLPRGGAMASQPLHVHVEVDGREIATAVLDDLSARAARR